MESVIKWLKDNERSGSWLARKCDVSPVTVHYWLNGKFQPSETHRYKLHDITGVEV